MVAYDASGRLHNRFKPCVDNHYRYQVPTEPARVAQPIDIVLHADAGPCRGITARIRHINPCNQRFALATY